MIKPHLWPWIKFLSSGGPALHTARSSYLSVWGSGEHLGTSLEDFLPHKEMPMKNVHMALPIAVAGDFIIPGCCISMDPLMVSRKCMFLGSLSHHNKDLEWGTLKPPWHVSALRSWIDHVIALRSRMDRVIALRQISVTALFYLEDSRKIHLRGVRARRSKDAKGRAPQHAGEREPFGSSFYMFFPSPRPALCKLGLVRSAVLPEVLTLVLGSSFDLPPFYFRGLFSSLSFNHRHFGLLFPILTA